MVEGGPDDDHGAPLGLVGVVRKGPGHGDDLLAFHPGDSLLPCRRVGHVVVEGAGDVVATQSAIDAVVGREKVEDRGDRNLSFPGSDGLHRDMAPQHVVVIRASEVVVERVAEIGESDRQDVVTGVQEAEAQPRGLSPGSFAFLDVPLAVLSPAVTDGSHRANEGIVHAGVHRNGLPFGVVGLTQCSFDIGSAQQAIRHPAPVRFSQGDQHRHVGEAPAVVLEVGALRRQVPFLEDDMSHGEGEGGIRALLGVEPDIGELRRLAVVGRDRHGGGALVADLGHEVGIGRACLWHVRAPHHEEGRVVPVGALGHVGLFAPGLRARRRQIAVPVVEAHADAADQRQVARPGGIGDHRHRRDRRKADHPVRSVGPDGMDVGGGDDLVDLVPGRTDESTVAADLLVVPALAGIACDRGPRGHRLHGLARLAPVSHQPAAHQRILEPVGAVDVPGVAGAARTAARLVVRQVGPGAGIIGLLSFPGDDPALDVDLPAARPGAVHPVGRAHDLVVAPARPVGVLPGAVFARDHPVPVREGVDRLREEGQSVQEMAHRFRLLYGFFT